MEIEKLWPSDSLTLRGEIENFAQVLPRYGRHSEAVAQFSKALRQRSGGDYHKIKLEKGRFLYLEWQQLNRALVIQQLLIYDEQGRGREVSVTQVLQAVEKFARQKRLTQIQWPHLPAPTLFLPALLQKAGYVFHLEQALWQKTLTYRTALVLGGGGARGAYQVGVWQALAELSIVPKIVTGTSVGALNGAFMAQNQLAAAQKMWEEIATWQILQWPNNAAEHERTLKNLAQDITTLTVAAIRQQGVDTSPMQKMLDERIDPEKLAQSSLLFGFPVTHLPTLKEKDIWLETARLPQISRWLLGTASFFPAMAAAEIDGQLYMDGGYRNNLPVDLALQHQPTEILVVDIKGPGFNKNVKIPPEIPVTQLESAFTLGTVLLFDKDRARWNMRLGYLETLKNYGKYTGGLFSFYPSLTKAALFEKTSWRFVKSLHTVVAPSLKMSFADFWQQLVGKGRNVYKETLKPETLALGLLELTGEIFEFSPVEVYHEDVFYQKICQKLRALPEKNEMLGTAPAENNMLLSVTEWFEWYQRKLLPFSLQQQVAFCCEKIQMPDAARDVAILWKVVPVAVCLAYFWQYLQNESEEETK